METYGTNERKRAARARPPALGGHMPIGCVVFLAVYLATCLAFLWFTNRLFFLALGIPGLIVVGYGVTRYAYGVCLLIAVRVAWSPRGVRCLLVHSNSPAWDTRVRTVWLPSFGHLAVTLNWSERASWRQTLSVRVFNRFCRRTHNFNPAVVVFRGLRQPLVFRFFYAFHEAQAGRTRYLEGLEADLFPVLGVAAPRA